MEVGFVNYWTKITFVVFALIVSIIVWAQINNLTKPSSAPLPVVKKLYFEGTIGGKHKMSLSINRVGRNITGTIVNTHREIRKLKGFISEDKRFLFSEYLEDQVTGTFEGEILGDGNMRGIWSTSPGIKRYHFYLNRKQRI